MAASPTPSAVGPIQVHGNPTEAEIAAIVAAIEMSWPKPQTASARAPSQTTTWRHADRWWNQGRLPTRWK